MYENMYTRQTSIVKMSRFLNSLLSIKLLLRISEYKILVDT